MNIECCECGVVIGRSSTGEGVSHGFCKRCTACMIAKLYEDQSGWGWKVGDMEWTEEKMPVSMVLSQVGTDAWEHVFIVEMSFMNMLGYLSKVGEDRPGGVVDPDVVVACDHEGRIVEVWDGWHRIAAVLKAYGLAGTVRVLVGRQR